MHASGELLVYEHTMTVDCADVATTCIGNSHSTKAYFVRVGQHVHIKRDQSDEARSAF